MRCSICDFSSLEGSNYLGLPPDPNKKIKYNTKFKDYYCPDCLESIRSTYKELKQKNVEE